MHSFAFGLQFAILARRPVSDYAEISRCTGDFAMSLGSFESGAAVDSNGTGGWTLVVPKRVMWVGCWGADRRTIGSKKRAMAKNPDLDFS